MGFIFWRLLYLISLFQMDYYLGSYSISIYRNWLIIISLIILYLIFVFAKDTLNLFLINCLCLNIFLFFYSINVFVFYIMFEFGLVPMMLLILIRGYQPERVGATLWFVLYTIFGSLPLLIVLIYRCLNFCRSRILVIRTIRPRLLFFPFIVGFLIKLPVYGFHLWLPKAHVQAPVEGRIFLAAIILKMGGFGILFIKPLLNSSRYWGVVTISFSVIGSVLAILYCLILDDLKMIIAYRRIGHIGLVVGTVLRDNEIRVWRRLIIIVGHGFTSSLIFYLGNDIYKVSGTRSISITKGLIRLRSTLIIFTGLVLILNISFPPSINVFGEMRAIMRIIIVFPSRIFIVIILVLLGGIFNIRLYIKVSHGMRARMTPSYKMNSKSIAISVIHYFPYLLLPFFFYAQFTLNKVIHSYYRITNTYKYFDFLKLWKDSRSDFRDSDSFWVLLKNTLHCRYG